MTCFIIKLVLDASAGAHSGISAKVFIENDDLGICLQPSIKFHGIVIKLEASLKIVKKDDDDLFEESDEGYLGTEVDIAQETIDTGEGVDDGGKEFVLMEPTPDDKERLDMKWYIIS